MSLCLIKENVVNTYEGVDVYTSLYSALDGDEW
jgi:hypothetical protein